MAVTIKDVALLAGVSPSTVSRTCKDNPSISNETKEKVRKAMAELGYEPNFPNTTNTSQETRTIGIILPPSQKEVYENSFYLETIHGISSFCNHRHYTASIVTGKNEEELLEVIQSMQKKGQVDGFILLYSKMDDSIFNYLYNEGILYVLVGKAHQYANQVVYVDNDNLLAGKEATEHLIQSGHHNIAFVGKNFDMLYTKDRMAGYQLAMTANHLSLRPDYVVEATDNASKHLEILQEFLEKPERPSAIVCGDDILALSVERACLNLGIKIPEDLSIVSFNNSILARLTSPQLTSIEVNSLQLGIEAASQMINHIENPNLMATKIIVPHRLVERGTCINISDTFR